MLRKKGDSQPGNRGGWELTANPDKLTLADVRSALMQCFPNLLKRVLGFPHRLTTVFRFAQLRLVRLAETLDDSPAIPRHMVGGSSQELPLSAKADLK